MYFLFCLIASVMSFKEPPFCINCKHFMSTGKNPIFGKCALYPKNEGRLDYLVSGIIDKDQFLYCSSARDANNRCGEEGNNFVEKSNDDSTFIPLTK